MNLCFKYPTIYWDCACLITNSGGEDGGTDYDKVAIALNRSKDAGAAVKLPDINQSSFGFKPDKENNQILCGFKSLVNVGDDLVLSILNNRPYSSIKDFYEKVKPNKQAMISLIKGGAFDNLIDRQKAMIWYIWETCDKKKRVTLQNMGSIIEFDLLPKEEKYNKALRIYEFNRYLKTFGKGVIKDCYKLDERAINFLNEIEQDDLIKQKDTIFYIVIKEWDKQVYQKEMDIIRAWISSNPDNILKSINENIFKREWDKYAEGNLSSWEMDALCFYYHEHELKHLNKGKYGISDFISLPEEPVVADIYKKGNAEIKIFKLTKICGTVIAKDKAHSTVTLLTPTGVVSIKLRKEQFAIYDKRVSRKNPDGTKTIIEKSWFDRGNMLFVQGMRSGSDFLAKKYASTGGHTLYKILAIDKNGDVQLQDERIQGE